MRADRRHVYVSARGHRTMICVTDKPLSPTEVLEGLKTDASGAVVMHSGVVRASSEGKGVACIEYGADVCATEEELSCIATDIAARWQVQDVALCRRMGRLKPVRSSWLLLCRRRIEGRPLRPASTPWSASKR